VWSPGEQWGAQYFSHDGRVVVVGFAVVGVVAAGAFAVRFAVVATFTRAVVGDAGETEADFTAEPVTPPDAPAVTVVVSVGIDVLVATVLVVTTESRVGPSPPRSRTAAAAPPAIPSTRATATKRARRRYQRRVAK
jgi:hypothetical protein